MYMYSHRRASLWPRLWHGAVLLSDCYASSVGRLRWRRLVNELACPGECLRRRPLRLHAHPPCRQYMQASRPSVHAPPRTSDACTVVAFALDAFSSSPCMQAATPPAHQVTPRKRGEASKPARTVCVHAVCLEGLKKGKRLCASDSSPSPWS